MIARLDYFEQIKELIDKPQIKILTGIRRCGKSSALLLLKNELIERGIDAQQIISINFESFLFSDLKNAKDLYLFVEQKITSTKKYYILLDEIQEVEHWEKAINSFMVDFNVDVYITGSNSHLLSSELSTYLAGRYIEIPIFTLSFKEYLKFREVYSSENNPDIKQSFWTYIKTGGFPVLHTSNYSEETANKIVYDIYSSVILRDTVQRYKIRDIELLERVIKYVFDNIGNTFSGKNIADYFKNQQRKIDINTIYNYLYALEGAFIIYRTSRFDLKGKEILKTQEKFYVSDIGLIYATLGYKDRMISGILENIVYLELKRRNYKVYVGKNDDKEIDFIAEKIGKKIYVQVAYKLENQETVSREFNNLLSIKDQYPKYVVTMDDIWQESIEGVKHLHISSFLLDNNF